ncbi:hypothetical protein [Afipia felis]|uniref:Uncharacterized protein n=2 Tax=Afipia felis TaxID=1035 RepID=A0A380W5L5_AFIFE|nr:hypothetical protein [Afipia felis]EKS26708.1 hypothetical protein HMPREF9697_04011 [Afipia felis ATCC 53690]SUU76143.1 Uncharacterised protein [Afipia felis]SUU84210.1 Uncharacterised protein [Afipia felis]SUW28230.1 Uncharacterised protein [Afipia felis]
MSACAIPRRASVGEFSPADAPDVQQDKIVTLDLEGCNFTYFNLIIEQRDLEASGIGHRFETWPPGIQEWMNKEVAAWRELHPNAAVKAVTTGISGDTAVLALHWRAKT